MEKQKEKTQETDFDKFHTNLIEVIMYIREEVKWQYHKFVELESKINKLSQDFIQLQLKYEPEEARHSSQA